MSGCGIRGIVHGFVSRGVRSCSIDDNDHLIMHMTDGSFIDLGEVTNIDNHSKTLIQNSVQAAYNGGVPDIDSIDDLKDFINEYLSSEFYSGEEKSIVAPINITTQFGVPEATWGTKYMITHTVGLSYVFIGYANGKISIGLINGGGVTANGLVTYHYTLSQDSKTILSIDSCFITGSNKVAKGTAYAVPASSWKMFRTNLTEETGYGHALVLSGGDDPRAFGGVFIVCKKATYSPDNYQPVIINLNPNWEYGGIEDASSDGYEFKLLNNFTTEDNVTINYTFTWITPRTIA